MFSKTLCAVLYAQSIARLAPFYEAVLAMHCELSEPDVCLLTTESLELTIVQAPPHIADAIHIGNPPAVRDDTPIKLSFLVPGIEDLRSTVQQHGGLLKSAEQAWSWRGYRHLDGTDPEGNVFQLRQRDA